MRIPPPRTKILLESNPLKSRILVRRLAARGRCRQARLHSLSSRDPAVTLRTSTGRKDGPRARFTHSTRAWAREPHPPGRTFQQGLAGGGRGKLASARKHRATSVAVQDPWASPCHGLDASLEDLDWWGAFCCCFSTKDLSKASSTSH